LEEGLIWLNTKISATLKALGLEKAGSCSTLMLSNTVPMHLLPHFVSGYQIQI